MGFSLQGLFPIFSFQDKRCRLYDESRAKDWGDGHGVVADVLS